MPLMLTLAARWLNCIYLLHNSTLFFSQPYLNASHDLAARQMLSPLAGSLKDGVQQQAAVEATLGLSMFMWMVITGATLGPLSSLSPCLAF